MPKASPALSQQKPSIIHPMYVEMPTDMNDDAMRRGSNHSDDEENMTPAQSRRKAQNRAA